MFAAMGLMTLCGCNHTKQKPYLDTPSIYKAWDARYQYDSSKRQLIPLYDNQQVGRAWGRDPNGRMNYALYYDGKGKPEKICSPYTSRDSTRKEVGGGMN